MMECMDMTGDKKNTSLKPWSEHTSHFNSDPYPPMSVKYSIPTTTHDGVQSQYSTPHSICLNTEYISAQYHLSAMTAKRLF